MFVRQGQTKLMNLQKEFSKNNNSLRNKRTLIATSGGIDSIVLCELFSQAGFEFGISHCNFSLRGKESDADEQLVKSWAEKRNVPFHTIKFDTQNYAAEKNVSIQLAARELRYEWFEKVRAENKYDYIATAHHLNDNIETILLNFAKGTGIRGLRGIPAKQNRIIRPLLFATREVIEAFQKENQLEYREDSSNSSDKYTRNKIRHHIIPLLKEINPNLELSIAENITVYEELESLYSKQITKLNQQLFLPRGTDIFIPILKLKKLSNKKSVLYEYLRAYDFTTSQVDDILESLDGDAGKQFITEKAIVIKDRQFLILTKPNSDKASTILIQQGDTKVQIQNGVLSMETIAIDDLKIKADKAFAYLNWNKLEFPLTLRHWKTGDYFYPFGMDKKKKKLSKFFKDIKKPLHEKDKVWILQSGEKICWVVGERIDERFKITSSTTAVLKLTFETK
jgi:tRNA(Ile)-lysidine synthase